ncbi:MAG TPA: HAD family hydrolase [Acidobacteriaceae bacterium]|nr:HAD family hydrolase [Acidobacteriaceae bacterium]
MEPFGKALFLDRDGVVNREISYLWQAEHTEFTPGIFDLCRVAQGRGYKLIILTNQSGIAREMYSEGNFHDFMLWMASQFKQQDIELDAYYYCPHHPIHGKGKYHKDCADRKPNPGMLLRASEDHLVDLARSIFIGDRCSDACAGTAASIGTMILMQNGHSAWCPREKFHARIANLLDAIPLLVPAADPEP